MSQVYQYEFISNTSFPGFFLRGMKW